MQPNQNPYDFLNAPAPKKGFSATTQKGRLIQVAIFASILLVVFGVIFSVVFSSDSGPKKPLLEVAAAQADIIALCAGADTNIRDTSLKAKNTSIRFTVVTQNNDTKTLLGTYGVGKDVSKQAEQYQDTTYEAQLKKALEENAHDAAYQTILANKIGVYRAKLLNAYSAVGEQKQKTQIANFMTQLEQLVPSSATQ